MHRFEKFNPSKANKLAHELEHIKTKLVALGLYQTHSRVDVAIKQLQAEGSSAKQFKLQQLKKKMRQVKK